MMSQPRYQFNLSAVSITKALVYSLAILLALHLGVVVFHLGFSLPMGAYAQLFDFDLEANIPTYFNSALFFFCALLMAFIAMHSEGVLRRGWLTLVAVFIFLGVDEGSQIHEKFMLVTLRLINHGTIAGQHFGWLYYAWVIPYGIAAFALGLWLLRWFIALEGRLRGKLVLSGVVYLFGAVFLEMLSGKIAEDLDPAHMSPALAMFMPCEVYDLGTCHLYLDPSYIAAYTLEETYEMAGLILLAFHLLRWLEQRNTLVELSFASKADRA